MSFFETSAKSGVGIKEAFESISREIIKDLDARGGQTKGNPRENAAQARSNAAGDSRPARFNPEGNNER